eukprot:5787275-Karenia_brevis.AAC.1
MSNCAKNLQAVEKRCAGDHDHQVLISGRTKYCAEYPPKLVAAIIRGLKKALLRIGILQEFEIGPTVEEPCPAEMSNYGKTFYDEIT